MYISASTYGGMDWHDSCSRFEQIELKDGSYDIPPEMVHTAIADDMEENFPYVENIKEKTIRALTEKSCFKFPVKTESQDEDGNTVYEDCATYDDNGETWYENEASFDGEKMELKLDYAFGQVSYTTRYHVTDIPSDQLGYVVTEDFLAPTKGVDTVQRLYHDIFDNVSEADEYAKNMKLHEFDQQPSLVCLLVCDKGHITGTEWYKKQKEAMLLMEEKGQTYLDESFSIFVDRHIENLKSLEAAAKEERQESKSSETGCETSLEWTETERDQGSVTRSLDARPAGHLTLSMTETATNGRTALYVKIGKPDDVYRMKTFYIENGLPMDSPETKRAAEVLAAGYLSELAESALSIANRLRKGKA